MEVKIQHILAKNVKSRRERMNISQTELGNRVGLSLSGIQKIERGDRWPSPDNVEKIANALGVPATALFSGLPSRVTPQEALAVLADHIWRLENG